MKMRLVLDTQIWIDWLVFDDPSVAPIKAALATDRAEIFIDAACRAELERVLTYPFGSRSVDASACLAECLRISKNSDLFCNDRLNLPACRDPDDQKFLELAAVVRANFLITRDRALLDLAKRRLPFHILAPEAFGLR
jgi:putative PIN family toxin of toxin-antitoxin system